LNPDPHLQEPPPQNTAITPNPQLPVPSRKDTLQPVSTWTVDQVKKWLQGLDPTFSAYSASFQQQQINGIALLELSEDNLKNDLNITPLGHRKVIIREILNLKLQTSEPTNSHNLQPVLGIPVSQNYQSQSQAMMPQFVTWGQPYTQQQQQPPVMAYQQYQPPVTMNPAYSNPYPGAVYKNQQQQPYYPVQPIYQVVAPQAVNQIAPPPSTTTSTNNKFVLEKHASKEDEIRNMKTFQNLMSLESKGIYKQINWKNPPMEAMMNEKSDKPLLVFLYVGLFGEKNAVVA